MNRSKAPHPSPLPEGEGIDRGDFCPSTCQPSLIDCRNVRHSTHQPPLPLGEGWGEGNARTRLSLLFAALLFTPLAHAFNLQQLSDQLAKSQVIHGEFIQEKHLRALPKPLTSTGTFVLAKDHGLLWQLKTPLQQDYRITAQGIARRNGTQWQMLPGKSAGAEQNRLFLAVLQGDSSGLQRDFDLQLQGEPTRWTLTLTPRSLLLKQVFNQINIEGGELVQRIELQETQGDSTLLKLQNSVSTQPLSDAEQHDFAQ